MIQNSAVTGDREFHGMEELNRICERFEDELRSGSKPSIETYLARYRGLNRGRLFSFLLDLELDYRTGSTADAETHAANDRAHAVDEREAASSGEAFGDYRILREIGRGGMGVVYEAYSLTLRRRVALKILPFHLIDSGEAAERFQREARAAARLHHPHIVQVFEVGEIHETPYFAMQLIEGGTLSEWTRALAPTATQTALTAVIRPGGRRKLSLATVVAEIGLQIARALQHAHERGVLHRDIKPSNLILDKNGVCWISDFGLARIGDSELTRTNALVGTIRYMAPERFAGGGDERSDIYSIGATLYELLARVPLFTAPNEAELMRLVIDTIAEPISSKCDGVPRDLETILEKALAKQPADRYASAQALADDLQRFLNDESIVARKANAVVRCTRWIRRHRVRATLISSCAVLLLAGVAAAWVYSAQRDENLRIASSEKEAVGDAITSERERQGVLYRSHMSLAAQASLLPIGFDRMRELTAPWDDEAGAAWRGWEWHLFRALEAEELRAIPSTERYNSCEFHPTEPWIAAAGKGFVFVVNFETGERLIEFGGGHVNAVRWSPSGDRLAAGDNDGVRVWNASTWSLLHRFAQPWVLSIGWDPEGLSLFASDYSGSFSRWSLPSEAVMTRVASDGPALGRHAAISRDGRFFAAGGGSQKYWISILDGTTLQFLSEFGPMRGSIPSFSWSADGRYLASCASVSAFWIWDVAKKSELVRFDDHEDVINATCWSNQGHWLASASADHSVRIWDVEEQRCARVLRAHEGSVSALSWHASDRLLATTDLSMLRIWDLDRAPSLQFVPGQAPIQNHLACIAWHPEGDVFASSYGRHCELRMEHSGTQLARLEHTLAADWVSSGDLLWLLRSRERDELTLELCDPNLDPALQTIPLDLKHRYLCGFEVHQVLPFAAVHDRDRLCIVNANGESALLTPPESLASYASHWHPERGLLAIAGGAAVWLYDAESKRSTVVIRDTNHLENVAWNHDGSQLATIDGQGGIEIWETQDWKRVLELRGHTSGTNSLRWSPSGDRIATAGEDRTVRIWDREGREITLFRCASSAIALDWSRDGKKLAALCKNGERMFWNASAGY